MSAGGAIMGLGVHCLDIMQFVTNDEIAEVKSFYDTKTFKYEVEDSGAILFKTKKSIFGHIDVNFNISDNAAVSRLEVYGTKGSLIAEGTLGQTEAGTLTYLYSPQADYSAIQERIKTETEVYIGANSDIYAKQAEDFSAGILSGKLEYKFAECSVNIQKICDNIYSESKNT